MAGCAPSAAGRRRRPTARWRSYLLEETYETTLEAIDTGESRRTCARSSATCCCRSTSTPRSPRRPARSTSTTWPADIIEKMIRRNPHVFGDVAGDPTRAPDQRDLGVGQGGREAARESVLDGIPPDAARADPAPTRCSTGSSAPATPLPDARPRRPRRPAAGAGRRGASSRGRPRAGAARRRTPGRRVTRRGSGLLGAVAGGRAAAGDHRLRGRHRRRAGAGTDHDDHRDPQPVGRAGSGHDPGRRRRTSPRPTSVWAQGGVLHVGRQQVDLSPIEIEAFVVVPGGVFLLSPAASCGSPTSPGCRGTGQTDVTGVRTNADGTVLVVVDTRSGRPMSQGYDTATGRAIRGPVDTLTPERDAGRPGRRAPAGCRLPSRWTLGRVARATRPRCGTGGAAWRETGRWCAARRRRRPDCRAVGSLPGGQHAGGLRHRVSSPTVERVLRGITRLPPLG